MADFSNDFYEKWKVIKKLYAPLEKNGSKLMILLSHHVQPV